MSKRRHNFGTKRFKEKSLFIFHARIALKSLILLFVRLIARGGDTEKKYCNPRACAPRVNYSPRARIARERVQSSIIRIFLSVDVGIRQKICSRKLYSSGRL